VSLEAIFKKIDENADASIEELKRLCRQPSISAQGIGLIECAELVKEMLEETSISAEIIPLSDGPPVVYGELKGQNPNKTMLFYDHYDVQPPEPLELWESDPWACEIRDGKLYARGAADNKGNIASRLAAIKALLAVNGELPCNIKFVIEGEEETGSPHFSEFIEQHGHKLAADACIWEFGGLDDDDIPAVTLGLKGMLYVEYFIKTAHDDSHSSRAAVIENPAFRLAKALSSMRDENGMILIEGWFDDVREFAPLELETLERAPLNESQLRSEIVGDRLLGGMSGLDLKKAFVGSPTANIAGFHSGYGGPGHKTVLPAEARAKMDFRLVPDQDPEKLARLLRKHLETHGFGDIEVTIQSDNPAARTPVDSEIAKVAAETAREVFGKEPNIHVGSAGSGPMYLFTNVLNIPTVAIGCNHPGTNIHAPNEHQRIDAFHWGTKWIAAALTHFGRE